MNKTAATSLREPRPLRAPAKRRAEKPRLHVMLDAPRVVPVYWDKHFHRKPSDVIAFNEFLRILFKSTFMNGLSANGVKPARVLPAFVPSDEPPTKLTRARLEAQLNEWIASERLLPRPKKLESSLLYLVLTPFGSQTSLGAPTPTARNFGFHGSIAFARGAEPQKPGNLPRNLHYAAVPLVSTSAQILEVHSRAICQQLGLALVERAQHG